MTQTHPGINLRAAIGQRIRLAREAAGVTQLELAEAIGLTRTSIANIEAGPRDSCWRMLRR